MIQMGFWQLFAIVFAVSLGTFIMGLTWNAGMTYIEKVAELREQ